MQIPPEKQKILDSICQDLQQIEHVSAIVLGGSYATGRANPNSDLDIGIYYQENNPFNINEIQKVVDKYAVNENSTVTDFYEWGQWVNGGAWIETSAGKVDLLYRNSNQIRRTIQASLEGILENNFEQQPPYGFSSVFYLAEIESCIPLYDPQHLLTYLKSLIKVYPEPLKKTIIQESLWSAEFTLMAAAGYVEKEDYYAAFGCFTRALKSMVSALFAINENYPIGEKYAIDLLEKMEHCPKDLKRKINSILTAKKPLGSNLKLLQELLTEIINLSDNLYKPKYNL